MDTEKKIEEKILNILTIIENMLEILHGGVSITDSAGYILKLGKSCKEMYGIDNSYIGKNLLELEERGVFRPSVTKIALTEQRKITMTQPDKYGNPLLVTSMPIFYPGTNRLLYAISYASWDINHGLELHEQYSQMLEDMTQNIIELNILNKRLQPARIVANSQQMKQVVQLAEKVADLDVELLICGEAGSGKSNLAKYIHQSSNRETHPFGQLRCSAFSRDGLESRLFGVTKVVSRSGDMHEKNGICESLNTGTLLLEDIEYMMRDTQANLLYLIKNKRYYKKDGSEPIAADLRIITTTRKNSKELAALLDPDLFYRLTVITIDMPCLKNRKEDIPELVEIFLKRFNEKYQKRISIAPRALELLQLYSWPGNVTELKCLIQQMVLTLDEDTINTHHLPDCVSPFSTTNYTSVVDLKAYLEFCEERLVLQAYDKCQSTVKLAKYLGISQATAVRKLQKYLRK